MKKTKINVILLSLFITASPVISHLLAMASQDAPYGTSKTTISQTADNLTLSTIIYCEANDKLFCNHSVVEEALSSETSSIRSLKIINSPLSFLARTDLERITTSILKLIQKHELITDLTLTHNAIWYLAGYFPEAWNLLFEAIAKHKNLTTLDLSDNNIATPFLFIQGDRREQSSPVVCAGIAQLKRITNLNLGKNKLGDVAKKYPASWHQFCESLTQLTNLQILDLKDNNLMPENIEAIQQSRHDLEILI